MTIIQTPQTYDLTVPTLIVGAGACGLCAALAASDDGAETVILEQSKTALGTTAMSTGLIPAAGTPEQAHAHIDDTPAVFAADIQAKNHQGADQAVVDTLAEISSDTVAWLRDTHDVPLTLVDGFLYPGHSRRRMYGTPNRTGSELMAALESAVQASPAQILYEARVVELHADEGNVIRGVTYERPDGMLEKIGCDTLILASCGFAGNQELVARHIPEMTNAVLHTHSANKGDALVWGKALGAMLDNLDAYQGHGGLAAGHGVPILWPTIMQGGFQLNSNGERFSDEAQGYSEQARIVLAQPDGIAWTVFDQAIFDMMLQFDDFADAINAGAIRQADSIEELAAKTRLPADRLISTFADVDACKSGAQPDRFGRDFSRSAKLVPPYYAVKVTGALFHTQGGLAVDSAARVLTEDGTSFPNLFAGGGAARGISGKGADGYMAGNGLLTATSLGRIAGRSAAAQISSSDG